MSRVNVLRYPGTVSIDDCEPVDSARVVQGEKQAGRLARRYQSTVVPTTRQGSEARTNQDGIQ